MLVVWGYEEVAVVGDGQQVLSPSDRGGKRRGIHRGHRGTFDHISAKDVIPYEHTWGI